MMDYENKTYQTLNELAVTGGTVIFGGTSDKTIPLCELKQAFGLQEHLYNRSFSNLSIKDAIKVYNSCVTTLAPSCILLHIGEQDIDFFKTDASSFEQCYRNLIQHIKNSAPKSTIVVITLKNPTNDSIIAEINQQLKYIADSERVAFEDISVNRVWNPKETKDVVSFVYSIGFVQPLKNRRSTYDLVKILFCYMPL